MHWIKISLLSFLIPILAAAKAKAETLQSLSVNGSDRSYLIFTPPNLPAGKLPLMLVLHGAAGNAERAFARMGMNEVAVQNHFIVAYPNGIPLKNEDRRVWNAGDCCAFGPRKNIDDVKFIDALVKDIEKKYPIDAKRIYVSGESNGGMLTYRLVCELPDIFAAAVAVSGDLMIDQCKGGKQVAFFDIHGAADKNVPYDGGRGKDPVHIVFRSVPDSIKMIREGRLCETPELTTLPNGDLEADYSCKNGASIRTRLIKGGGHPWPPKTSEMVWDFTKNFSRK